MGNKSSRSAKETPTPTTANVSETGAGDALAIALSPTPSVGSKGPDYVQVSGFHTPSPTIHNNTPNFMDPAMRRLRTFSPRIFSLLDPRSPNREIPRTPLLVCHEEVDEDEHGQIDEDSINLTELKKKLIPQKSYIGDEDSSTASGTV